MAKNKKDKAIEKAVEKGIKKALSGKVVEKAVGKALKGIKFVEKKGGVFVERERGTGTGRVVKVAGKTAVKKSRKGGSDAFRSGAEPGPGPGH